MYGVAYHPKVLSVDISKLGTSDKRRVQKVIEEKLMTNPEVYGMPLRKSLRGYRKIRVGNYRVIFKIKNKWVLVFLIEHRSVAYIKIYSRM
ncbi:hypothetical protein A3I25_00915 [Candidatus Nomurabacteria bacterium RIFCSPLOWO2_02_FULL_42_17]|uniref:Addiction module antitoxin RelB n=1 Tax=Candidatus Nomurabacteria bacterium RIFCSPLOWO2_02_FULL_42_17 TaxID=1801789 RepID=A0A1F6XPY9_9BACT|nr:MAG: hypothetical protein A3I25_00915 [Candidatus Nomurabacteria bacterium RIFCSPLOWO2_02_FULL_42_17]